MELKTYFAQDASGNIMPGAAVTVYLANTLTLATGLEDENGSPLSNPFAADSSAKVSFYAPDGLYDITVVGNGRTVTIRAQFVTVDGASVLRNDLAATGGAALVGYDGGTAQDVLDDAKPMANYTALRAYTGRATGVRITQAGIAGFFRRDDADPTSADNGGTIIVDASGRRWKRLYAGLVNVRWFGAKGDWNGSTGTDDTAAFQVALNTGNTLHAPDGVYLLTSTLSVMPTSSLIGSSAANCVLMFNANVHGFTFPRESGRQKKLFTGFTVAAVPGVTTAKYAFYFPGTDVTQSGKTYCSSYTFRDITVNDGGGAVGNQFAGGFRLKDTFRARLESITITLAAIDVRVEGQCVETSIVGVIGNGDYTNTQFGAGDIQNIGVTADVSSEYFGGQVNVPEGLYVLNSSFVAHKAGFQGGALNCVVSKCEFDLFYGSYGASIKHVGSAIVFSENWVSPAPGNSTNAVGTSGPIGIWTTTNTFTVEPTQIVRNTVYASAAANSLPAGGVAICVGTAGFAPNTSVKGAVIEGNSVFAGTTAGSKWSVGISADRCENTRILNNTVQDNSCSAYAIDAPYQTYAVIQNNSCGNLTISFACYNAGGFGSVSDNKCSSFSNGSSGHTPANWNFARNLP